MASSGFENLGENVSYYYPPKLSKDKDGQVTTTPGEDDTHIVIHDREMPGNSREKIDGPPGPLNFGTPYSDGVDPGVMAVSTALFAKNTIFEQIPVKRRNVFRRRRISEHNSEWSNSFPTFTDPCDCCTAVEETT